MTRKVSKRKKHGKKKSGRSCRVCGKDPAPNYFFCRACHQRVVESNGNETEEFRVLIYLSRSRTNPLSSGTSCNGLSVR